MTRILKLTYDRGLTATLTVEGSQAAGSSTEPRKDLTPKRLDELVKAFERAVAGTHHDAAGSWDRLKDAGYDLWADALPDMIRQELRKTSDSILVLELNSSTVKAPWELLYDGTCFLMERFAVGRRMEIAAGAWRGSPRSVARPIRILFVADPQENLPAARKEMQTLCKHCSDLLYANVGTRFGQTAGSDLATVLTAYDIVYYAGHSDERGNWQLADGNSLKGSQIKSRAEEPIHLPALIIAGSCHSAAGRGWLNLNQTIGFAQACLEGHMRSYIGTFWKIPDSEVSSGFGIALLKGILANVPIGEALRDARNFKPDTPLANLISASYVLYGHPGVKLLDPLEGQSGAVVPPPPPVIVEFMPPIRPAPPVQDLPPPILAEAALPPAPAAPAVENPSPAEEASLRPPTSQEPEPIPQVQSSLDKALADASAASDNSPQLNQEPNESIGEIEQKSQTAYKGWRLATRSSLIIGTITGAAIILILTILLAQIIAPPTPPPTPTPPVTTSVPLPRVMVKTGDQDQEVLGGGTISFEASPGCCNTIAITSVRDGQGQTVPLDQITYSWAFLPPDADNARMVGPETRLLYYNVPADRAEQTIIIGLEAAGKQIGQFFINIMIH